MVLAIIIRIGSAIDSVCDGIEANVGQVNVSYCVVRNVKLCSSMLHYQTNEINDIIN